MKQLLTTIIISLSLVITGITAFASNTSSILHSKELISTFATDDDEPLGPVNLCDPNGIVCLNANAYKDHETGRIYVKLINSRFQTEQEKEYYAEKSNDSRWEYRIRYEDQWYYFSF